MTGAAFELRAYQREALLSFRRYLQKTVAMAEAAEHPARAAFNDATGFNFAPAPLVDPQTPFVCIRIPTGGGKTLVAAHSVGIAAKEFMQADNPMVLWLVPSTAILDQTLSALRNPEHPYRAALTAEFGRNLSVLTVAEALALSRPDATGGEGGRHLVCCDDHRRHFELLQVADARERVARRDLQECGARGGEI